jgi:hypothetical protein
MLTVTLPGWSKEKEGQSSETKTLLGHDAYVSAFGSFHSGVSPFFNKYVTYVGGDVALVLNNFYFGGYSSRVLGVHKIHPEDEFYKDKRIVLTQGGIFTGVTFLSKRIFQYSVASKFGWGYLTLRDADTEETVSRDRINIIMPTFQVKLNITSFIQICVGVNYQLIFGIDLPKMENKDFRGFGASFAVRVGWF